MPSTPQLVVTLGPASAGKERALLDAGATSLRLNASHLEVPRLVTWLERVRAVSADVPVVVDLQGAKMRVGQFPPRAVTKSAVVRFVLGEQVDAGDAVPVPHKDLFTAVRPGEVLSCDDDRLRCEVESNSGDVLVARWLTDGTLKPKKGINRAAHPVDIDEMSARDVAQVKAAKAFGPVSFAWSFMTDGRESAWLRALAPGCPVVGKMETGEPLAAIDGVLLLVDALWICRGDLGAQLGPAALARFVSRWRPPADGVPVLMAGQVLQHLASAAEPTRSEVCHLYDLLQRGYAGIVLSDETAVGVDPVQAVKTARQLLDALVS